MNKSDVVLIICFLFGFWFIVSLYNTIDTLGYVKDGQMTKNEYIGWRVVESAKSFLICFLISIPFLVYYFFIA